MFLSGCLRPNTYRGSLKFGTPHTQTFSIKNFLLKIVKILKLNSHNCC
nr:MAG TPA: hypothetical protein [Caudoviricetes sp.]DAP34092.1 MAG TPA: hypothetical protein [Caudoviricetes sp.]